jgi:hypothetical protein
LLAARRISATTVRRWRSSARRARSPSRPRRYVQFQISGRYPTSSRPRANHHRHRVRRSARRSAPTSTSSALPRRTRVSARCSSTPLALPCCPAPGAAARSTSATCFKHTRVASPPRPSCTLLGVF